ncbi:MAG: DNA polymerase Y family protein [Pseudolabrys sp.]|nr:DNA polymerase Y family protein [Pseudolabrys sp.]
MSAPSRRYLSVWLRRLSTDRIERRSSAPGEAPLIVVEPVKGALRIAALNDAAALLGLTPGLPLADARARYTSLQVAQAEPEADRALLVAVADWCDRYTPLVGLDAPDGLLLDITGCAHLFGGERAMARDMILRLARQGLQARIGIAGTVGCAWAMARHDKGGIVRAGDETATLAPLPPLALRIDPEIARLLAQTGLRRIADLATRPRAPLAARYGQELLRRLDQALGIEDESITPRLPVPPYVAERRFPDPIGREDDVLGTVAQLAQELCVLMERRGEGARHIQTALFRADGKVYRIDAGAGQPLRDPERIRRLFLERFAVVGDACDPGFGYDMIRLSALVADRMDPVQSGLGAPDPQAALTHLIDRLGARFGRQRIARLVTQDKHIPEAAVAMVPAHQASPSTPWEDEQDSLAPIRPTRMLATPERIDGVLNEVPDGAPVRFTWRDAFYHVAIAEGPERIAPEWWRDESNVHPRDYFRIETGEGFRAWIFRQDRLCKFKQIQDDGTEKDVVELKAHWFLHGLMA